MADEAKPMGMPIGFLLAAAIAFLLGIIAYAQDNAGMLVGMGLLSAIAFLAAGWVWAACKEQSMSPWLWLMFTAPGMLLSVELLIEILDVEPGTFGFFGAAWLTPITGSATLVLAVGLAAWLIVRELRWRHAPA